MKAHQEEASKYIIITPAVESPRLVMTSNVTNYEAVITWSHRPHCHDPSKSNYYVSSILIDSLIPHKINQRIDDDAAVVSLSRFYYLGARAARTHA